MNSTETLSLNPSNDEWEVEQYPTTDREWLRTSAISVSMGVSVAVLVADPLEEKRPDPVYPLAVTQDTSKPVYERDYIIYGVKPTLKDAYKTTECTMYAISNAFLRGESDFITEALNEVNSH